MHLLALQRRMDSEEFSLGSVKMVSKRWEVDARCRRRHAVAGEDLSVSYFQFNQI